ncbi:hypothetical protein [Larkinella humicola]|nr:hypothetical protein [Larkinella humicola]
MNDSFAKNFRYRVERQPEKETALLPFFIAITASVALSRLSQSTP